MSVEQAALIFRKFRLPQYHGLAKYNQFSETILAAIYTGHLKAEDRLPTESDFAAATPFSLGTVQRGLRLLVDHGIIERRRGIGTFVTRSANLLYEPLHCRFLTDSDNDYLPVYAQVLVRDLYIEPGPWSKRLGLDDNAALRIDRLLEIGDEFFVLSRFHFNNEIFGALADIPIEELNQTNFKVLLHRKFGIALTAFTESMRVTNFPADVCTTIDCRQETIGAILEIEAWAAEKMPVYFQELFIPPNSRSMLLPRRSFGLT